VGVSQDKGPRRGCCLKAEGCRWLVAGCSPWVFQICFLVIKFVSYLIVASGEGQLRHYFWSFISFGVCGLGDLGGGWGLDRFWRWRPSGGQFRGRCQADCAGRRAGWWRGAVGASETAAAAEEQVEQEDDEDEVDAAATVVAVAGAHVIAAAAEEQNEDDEKNNHAGKVSTVDVVDGLPTHSSRRRRAVDKKCAYY
jgi:hypothetical protein